jgi:peroxiredoxin
MKIRKMLPVAMISAIAVALTAFTTVNTGYKVGDKVGDFDLKNVDKKMVSLSGLQNNKGAIVIFTCNHCPFSIAYEDRIIELHKKYESLGYPVIAINPNDEKKVPEDSYKNMIKRAKEKKFPFVYLHDATQETARTYGAVRTPHVYILSKISGSYKVEYIGAIDNNSQEPEAVTERYVEKAIDELLKGQKVTTTDTKAIGCTIKWKS